jgi:hypothetical protein
MSIHEMRHEALSTISDWFTYLGERDTEQDKVLADIRLQESNPSSDSSPTSANPLSWLGVGHAPTTSTPPLPPGQTGLAESQERAVVDHTAAGLNEERAAESARPDPEARLSDQERPRSDAELELQRALAKTTVGDLPAAVLDAMWSNDPERLPRALTAARQQGQLPDRLAEAVGTMAEHDFHYAEALERVSRGTDPYPSTQDAATPAATSEHWF